MSVQMNKLIEYLGKGRQKIAPLRKQIHSKNELITLFFGVNFGALNSKFEIKKIYGRFWVGHK